MTTRPQNVDQLAGAIDRLVEALIARDQGLGDPPEPADNDDGAGEVEDDRQKDGGEQGPKPRPFNMDAPDDDPRVGELGPDAQQQGDDDPRACDHGGRPQGEVDDVQDDLQQARHRAGPKSAHHGLPRSSLASNG